MAAHSQALPLSSSLRACPTQVLGRLIIKYPHLLIIPLVVLGLLLGLGLWGVGALRHNRADSNEQSAYYSAENAASALQLDIYKGVIPLKQLEVLIKKYKNVQKVLNMTDEVRHGTHKPLSFSAAEMNGDKAQRPKTGARGARRQLFLNRKDRARKAKGRAVVHSALL